MRICEIAKGRPIVYVDMDGVLADLFNYSAELNNVEHYNQMSDAEFEQFFRNTDAYDLFRSIPMFPTANKSIKLRPGRQHPGKTRMVAQEHRRAKRRRDL